MSGLLAARVLSDHFKNVIVLERDDLSNEGSHRRGVPHDKHAHALLAGGQRILEQLFPGITAQLISGGAVPADSLNEGTWFFEGGPLYKTPSGTTGVMMSRPFLESVVRMRVNSIDRIQVLGNRSVRRLVSSDDGERVTGVVTEDEFLEADLVVDATGRATRSKDWLESLAYEPAAETEVEVDLFYTTRLFRLRPDWQPDNKFVVIAPTPYGKRGGVMAMQESGDWIVTLFGHFGHAAPGDLAGYTEYARSLPSPLIYEAICHAEPAGKPNTFRFAASRRRRYEKLRRFPNGFLVFGDAICSFNPIYGQGMSVAALQAKALHEALVSGRANIAKRFFKRAAKVIDNPWNIAVGGDLRIPETIGPRSFGVDIVNWYIANVHKLAHSDPRAALAFTRVSQLLDAPTALMRPAIMARVLLSALRRQPVRSRETRERLMTTIEPKRHASSDGF
jgi:2-polyprenyl-6-methoxyphenol hydroxylase-like FAD-dependent oxidoreductase